MLTEIQLRLGIVFPVRVLSSFCLPFHSLTGAQSEAADDDGITCVPAPTLETLPEFWLHSGPKGVTGIYC